MSLGKNFWDLEVQRFKVYENLYQWHRRGLPLPGYRVRQGRRYLEPIFGEDWVKNEELVRALGGPNGYALLRAALAKGE